MNRIRLALIIATLTAGLAAEVIGQAALRLPEVLTRAEKRVNINCLLSRTGHQLQEPWVVYSDRETGTSRFGDRFFVVEERETEVHVFRASTCRDRRLSGAVDCGWKRKSDLLVCFGADFTNNSLIHKKCVVLNHSRTIERIRRGEISESEIPLYSSPTAAEASGHVPLYLIYFVYKTENNRYLVGRDYRFDPGLPFAGQIAGWVDRDRVFDYNNRICFEPSPEMEDVAFRRCHPLYAARVFEFESELTRYLRGDSSLRPLWKEPDYYFFRKGAGKADQAGNAARGDMEEKDFSPALLEKLCRLGDDPVSIRKSGLLTGQPLPGNKFRFPLVSKENLPANIFMTGVTGRFENYSRSRQALCENLRTHRSQVSVYLVLDRSVDRNRLVYAIGQIQQEYKDFTKNYGVCFFPRTRIGQYKVSLEPAGKGQNAASYTRTRDFVNDYPSGSTYDQEGDHVLKTLDFVLKNESFDPAQTNIIILVNNRNIPIPDAGLPDLRHSISENMVSKNCYLLAFDYRGDNNLVQQLQEISLAAARQYAKNLHLDDTQPGFHRTEVGYEMTRSALLAVIEQADPQKLAAAEMQSFLLNGYRRILHTLDEAITKICQGEGQAGSAGDAHEDPFQRALRELPGDGGTATVIRALEVGYASTRYDLPSGNYGGDIWKTNVLMTRPELEALASMMDRMVVNTPNSNFSKAVSDLWIALFNRFVGDNLAPEELLPLTPQDILNRILGDSYGYGLNDPVKRFTLERIRSNDQEVQKYFDAYRERLTESNAAIRELLASGRLRFSLADDYSVAGQGAAGNGTWYYWVPMDLLP